jgi:molybdate transport system permease protein
MIAPGDLLALWITVKLALISTAVLLIIGTPMAWWLARTGWRLRPLVEATVALPLVLPPTVLGFYLLLALSPQGPIGGLTVALGGQSLAFTFAGLVIGSVFYSLPFVVQPLQASFAAIDPRLLEAAETLRAGPWDRFVSVVLPIARPGFLTAAVLGFAHTLGEFGVVLMIGGSIPGETRVVSIAIYEHVEGLRYGRAHFLAGLLLLVSFLMLVGIYALNRRFSVLRS